MMLLPIALVFILGNSGAESRAQRLDFPESDSSNFDATTPLGNCICTPFFLCFDEETSSSLTGLVNDRTSLPVVVAKQENEPTVCQDIIEVCCYKLTSGPAVNPTSNPSQSSTPVPALQPQSTIASLPQDNDFLSLLGGSTSEATPSPPLCTNDQPVPSNEACGVRHQCGVDFEVSGFTDGQAQYGEFPWVAAVLTSNTGFGASMGATNLFVGGGSLIHPQVVLTAAHKAKEHENKTLSVRLGEWNFAKINEPTAHQDIPVREIVYHHRFNFHLRSFNFALLVLEQPAVLGETVGTICLPSSFRQRFDGQQCIISGWGKDVFGQKGRYQRILKSVSVNMVESTQCELALRNTDLGSNFSLNKGFVCAGDRGNDACTGDGGSPLVCADPAGSGQYMQVGVTAWGIGCGQQGLPGVYSAVAPMMEWIDGQLGSLDIRNSDVRQG